MRAIRWILVPPGIGAIVALLLSVTPARAQRAAGPYEGVLGAQEETDSRHTLTFRGSVSAVWDDVLSESQDDTLDRRFLRSGFAGGASAGLTHARRTRRNDWLSSANSVLRVYGKGDDAAAATFAGRTSLTSILNSRVTFSSSGGFGYSPYYEFAPTLDPRFMSTGLFGGGFGVATAAERNTLVDGDAAIKVRLSRRNTFEVGGNGRRYDFLDQPDNSIHWYGGQAGIRHSLTRSLGLHAIYGREESEYESGLTPRLSTDTIDVGLDYGDTLKFSRRTAVSFSSSTSFFRWREETHFRVNGSAALTRAFGRTGSTSLLYSRETQFMPGFREPLLNDTISGGIADQIGRKAIWSASAGYTKGTLGFRSESSRVNSFNAGGRLTRALTRNLGVFGDYAYYRYAVPEGSTVFTFLPKFSRHSVSVGLSAWVPLLNDTRPSGRPVEPTR